ncbi:laccase [Panaeolus papilionaceus]|nr:laccase [Panaeolus papilionaceus]
MQNLLLLLNLALTAHAAVCRNAASRGSKYILEIGNANISPDGFERSAVLAGGTFPGPIISGQKGDRFQIDVINTLTDTSMPITTSVHWHGIFQDKTNWDDGAAWVSQCPILPNNSFSYDFSVPKQAGTFWYHSHLSTQYCDGLKGPFIVYDPYDPHKHLYDVDDETTVITLSDWYHEPSLALLGDIPPPSDTTLINGKGRQAGGEAVDLHVLQVEPGKRYRLRLISMSCDPNFNFSIDGHNLTIIEVDGENVRPLVVDSLQIFAGQRYSVILEANQAVDNYWIRAEPNLNRGTQGFDGGINSAILRYSDAAAADPTSTDPQSTNPLNEVNLHPLIHPAAPGLPQAGGADVVIQLNHTFDFDAFHFLINNATYVHPTVPVLLQILSGAHTAQELLPQDTMYALPKNKVIELVMPGSDPVIGGPHPFHLHGHTFSVVRSAGSDTYNYANPVRRDTVNTGSSNDSVTIRFVTDNAGPWFLHCHIDWHLELGLAVIMAEDVPNTVETPSAQWEQLCPLYQQSLLDNPGLL